MPFVAETANQAEELEKLFRALLLSASGELLPS
jgi:hypothetical protein